MTTETPTERKTKDDTLASNRRSLNHLLIKPHRQLKYSFFLFGVGLILLATFMAIFMITLNQTISSLSSVYQFDPDVSQALRTSLVSAMIAVVSITAALAAISVGVGVVLSHRIFGPMVSIQRHVIEMNNGNYKSRVKLRKKDEFQDLANALNDLAARLESGKDDASTRSTATNAS